MTNLFSVSDLSTEFDDEPRIRDILIGEDNLPLYLSLVQEMRLTHGNPAAQALWLRLPLPQPEIEPANKPTPDEAITAFLAECVEASPGFGMRGAVLYRAYADWCARNDHVPFTMTRFGRICGQLIRKDTSGNRVRYCDIRLRGER